jgi:transposase
MQGSKHCENRLFYQVSLESLVPQDHMLRRLASVVELGWVRTATAKHYSNTGKPSIDPVVIAKMMIVGFLYNINSERQLMREIQVNLAYRWYLSYDLDEDIPNHSVLSKARRRLGQHFFERLFGSVLQLCRQAGLIDGSNVLIDSTLVKGNASVESVTVLNYSPAQYFQQLDAVAEPEEQADVDQRQKGDELGSNRPGDNRLCDQKRSTTDPDATLARKGKTAVLGYKTHVCADSHKGVITAVIVSTAAADDTSAVPELLDKHSDVLDEMPQCVVADGAYGSQDCLAYVQNKGIETVIKKRSGGNKHGGYDKSRFVYDSVKDVFTCPAGSQLRRIRTDIKKSKAHYRCDVCYCGSCVQRSACLGKNSTARARTVTRFDTPYEARAQASCSSSLGRKLLTVRQTLLEGLFGQGKNFHGLGRARWRGLGNMLIQSLLIATVLNVKKLLSGSGRTAASVAASAGCTFDIILQICSLCLAILILRLPTDPKKFCESILQAVRCEIGTVS